jgi:UDP-glucose 4-epimerase
MLEPYRMYSDTTMSTACIIAAILKAGEQSKVKSLVFASSSAVESPESHYGVAKAASEMMLDVFREQMEGKVSVSSLRFGNVYGPRQNPANGTLIAKFIDCILTGNTPQIYGDGSQTRDYIYVDDVVDAIILCMEHEPGKVVLSRTMNVSTGVSVSVNRVCDSLTYAAKMLGLFMKPPEYVAAKPGDKDQVLMKSSEMLLYSGWHPETELAEGIFEQLNWANSMKGSWDADHYMDGSMA